MVSEIIDNMVGEESVMEENTQVKKKKRKYWKTHSKTEKRNGRNMSGSDFCWLPFF